MQPNPVTLPTPPNPGTVDAPSPLASLLARLRDENAKSGKRKPNGCHGKRTLHDTMAAKAADNPERVARREARRDERAKARAKRLAAKEAA
jgi:hypothetical protein